MRGIEFMWMTDLSSAQTLQGHGVGLVTALAWVSICSGVSRKGFVGVRLEWHASHSVHAFRMVAVVVGRHYACGS